MHVFDGNLCAPGSAGMKRVAAHCMHVLAWRNESYL